MKNNKYYCTLFLAFVLMFSSCNESEILKEVPLDFNSPENSFVTVDDFNSAIYAMYDDLRVMLSASENHPLDYLYGTDMGYNGAQQLNVRFGSYLATLTPTSDQAGYHWPNTIKLFLRPIL